MSSGHIVAPNTPGLKSKISRGGQTSRKTYSIEKDGVDFSLSSDPVDLRYENERLNMKLNEVIS